MDSSAAAEALIPQFKLGKILNQDWAGRRISLLGEIDSKPGLLLIERAALPSTLKDIETFHASFSHIKNLGANDIYGWYLANVEVEDGRSPDLKLNLIYPCTEKHVKKYSPQTARMVIETPQIYMEKVRPYMQRNRDEGRLNWVFNIVEGRTEQEDIILRESRNLGHDKDGFLILPDMNWDRSTISSLRLLALVERRDIWSLRDLKKEHVPWLEGLRDKIKEAVPTIYEGVDSDMLKLYIHCKICSFRAFALSVPLLIPRTDQPTYYHFHIHVVHISLEPNATQAVGKAFSLSNLISQLASMSDKEGASLADVSIEYSIGEASELWNEVFLPMKKHRTP